MMSTQHSDPGSRPRAARKFHFRNYEQFLKFLVVGGFGFVLNAVILRILSGSYHWDHSLANLVGAGVAIFSNFNWNNIWTFQGKRITGVSGYLWKLLHFYAASAFGVVFIQTGVIFLGTKLIGDGVLRLLGFGVSYYLLYFLAGTALLVVWNFFAYKKFIWNRTAMLEA
jgi:putative flippase GtrA